ncbi:MAG: hypothetical protein KKA05_04965 [Alphaproteobacteria bacterium]|nr:hypothetical protein [Alphaproteobacteria bacterium]
MDEEDFVEKELNLSDEPREYIDEDRVVGIYSSEEKAQAALERYKNKPGFIDKPNAFLIEKITLGKITGWTSGFGIE